MNGLHKFQGGERDKEGKKMVFEVWISRGNPHADRTSFIK
jgi:hypothetical protein